MGQCLPKQRRYKKQKRLQEKYQAKNSESQQPIVNGGQVNEISTATSLLSVDDKSGTQHISEREKADIDVNEHPADCATGKTKFLVSSQPDLKQRRKSHYDNHLINSSPVNPLKRSNSCSTIYLHETVSQPNMKNTIKAVALGIHNLIKNRRGHSFYQHSEGDLHSYDDADRQMLANLEIFDERAHPLTDAVPSDYATRNPEHKTVYRFIRTLFNQAQLNAECAIVTLVYLERLLTYADFELTPANWKRVTLGAIMLASKVWDDQAVWNVDYCQIFKDVSVEDMNALERQFLQILQFNTNVPSSVYAKYYFDLRALADTHDLSLSIEPLSKEKALKLEAMSTPYRDRIAETSSKVKRSASLDGFSSLNRSSIAIIS